MFTNSEKQALWSLKEENLKFLKKHESNKKEYIDKQTIKKFMDNFNQKIEDLIVENEKRNKKAAAETVSLPKKRKISEILSNNTINANENKALKKPRIMEHKIDKNSLDFVIRNPGLQHLAENIFSYLGYKDLIACQLINQSSNLILNNPKFWLQKFIQGGMSKKNQNDWIRAIQLTKNTNLERNLQLYLKKSLCRGGMLEEHGWTFDIPCYFDKNTLENSYEFNRKFGSHASIFNSITNKIHIHNMIYTIQWIFLNNPSCPPFIKTFLQPLNDYLFSFEINQLIFSDQ